MKEPFLVSRRTGKTIAKVVAFGFGGATVVLGLATTFGVAFSLQALFGAFRGYFLAAIPFFLFGGVLALCKRELWFVPEAEAFRMLTFRPWQLKGPRVEQGPLEDYQAVCAVELEQDDEQPATVVALVTQRGEEVAVREVSDLKEAEAFAQSLSEATGLPLRRRVERLEDAD